MKTYKANPAIISHLAERKRCMMCRHTKNEGHILPKGVFYPSPAWLFHYEDTHGIPHSIQGGWLYKAVYGIALDDYSINFGDG